MCQGFLLGHYRPAAFGWMTILYPQHSLKKSWISSVPSRPTSFVIHLLLQLNYSWVCLRLKPSYILCLCAIYLREVSTGPELTLWHSLCSALLDLLLSFLVLLFLKPENWWGNWIYAFGTWLTVTNPKPQTLPVYNTERGRWCVLNQDWVDTRGL